MVVDLNGINFICIYGILIFITYIWYRAHANLNYKYGFLMIFIFYILCVVKLAFFPIYTNMDGNLLDINVVGNEEKAYMQWIPGRSIITMLDKPYWFIQIVGNIVFLMPLPMFIRFLYFEKNIKSLNMTLIGISFSLFIELTQYVINRITCYPNRVLDIDDLILNSVGVLIGTCIIKKLENRKSIYITLRKIILKTNKDDLFF